MDFNPAIRERIQNAAQQLFGVYAPSMPGSVGLLRPHIEGLLNRAERPRGALPDASGMVLHVRFALGRKSGLT
jgi:hypothetical protein